MRPISDETLLTREALTKALAEATEPMTNIQLHHSRHVASLGVSADFVSRTLAGMYKRAIKATPLHRIPSSIDRSTWAYFNPAVVKLTTTPIPPEMPAKGAVNEVNPSPDFTFDPVEFEPAASTVDEPEAQPTSNVKSITLTVAGVTIKIDLN